MFVFILFRNFCDTKTFTEETAVELSAAVNLLLAVFHWTCGPARRHVPSENLKNFLKIHSDTKRRFLAYYVEIVLTKDLVCIMHFCRRHLKLECSFSL